MYIDGYFLLAGFSFHFHSYCMFGWEAFIDSWSRFYAFVTQRIGEGIMFLGCHICSDIVATISHERLEQQFW